MEKKVLYLAVGGTSRLMMIMTIWNFNELKVLAMSMKDNGLTLALCMKMPDATVERCCLFRVLYPKNYCL